jgi:RNA 3'-terminal phosphate cyclase (ATP)
VVIQVIEIDGSFGEGGGQILRSSLALAIVTGQPVRLSNIRAGRRKPGLMRQHLTAVNAAAAICGATVDGERIGATELTFTPGAVRAGEYQFSIGTAGSTTLVLQTVLLPLLTAGGPSRIVLEGGTHNPFAPPFDFLERAYLPLINRMGPNVRATLERPGFYPAGGGRIAIEIEPATGLHGFDVVRARRRRAASRPGRGGESFIAISPNANWA